MNKGLQKFSAWCGFIAANIFFAGLIVGNLFPPMSPSITPAEVQAFIATNAFGIKVGGLLIIISAMFCAPFDAAIYLQLKRMEGNRAIGALAQLGNGIANIQFFILPGVFFVIMAFRPDRNIDSLYSLFDLAWIVTMLPWTVGAMQCLFTGLAILGHPEVTNVYPRWVGFFNIWIAIGMATSSVIPFFKAGPFAWNGVVGFWIPATVFGLWMLVMWWMTLKAINTESPEDSTQTVGTRRPVTV